MVLEYEAILAKLGNGDRLSPDEFALLRGRLAEVPALREALRLEELSVEAVMLQNKKLAAESISDELTGVLNRRGIMDRLSRAYAHASHERYGGDIYLGFIDIARFKKANDMYDHEVGNEMLVRLARHLKDSLKMTDHIGRYGGDEFLIVLPRAITFGQDRLVDALESRVRGRYRDVISDIDPRGLVDLNLGVAPLMPGARLGMKQSIINADHALYESKLLTYLGQPRTCVFDPEKDYHEVRFDLESLRD